MFTLVDRSVCCTADAAYAASCLDAEATSRASAHATNVCGLDSHRRPSRHLTCQWHRSLLTGRLDLQWLLHKPSTEVRAIDTHAVGAFIRPLAPS